MGEEEQRVRTRFEIQETTIAELQDAIVSGAVTCVEIVDLVLARIAALDQSGPGLNSFVSLNPVLREQAAALDADFARVATLSGPLHGIPVAVKDQFETADMPTGFGSAAMRDFRSSNDAAVVRKLRAAGALVVGKTTVPDFCSAFFSASSLTGWTRNPYELDRDPGGSSSGTATAVAASLAVVGIGGDTEGSIRVPAAFTSLVGLRVTTGLISRAGMMPGITRQDTPGPIARTVEDAARLLDVLAGPDDADPVSLTVPPRPPGCYLAALTAPRTDPARVGVLRAAFSSHLAPTSEEEALVFEAFVGQLGAVGVELVDPFEVPSLQDHITLARPPASQFRREVDGFLSAHPQIPAGSLRDIHASGQFSPLHALFVAAATAETHDADAEMRYRNRIRSQDDFKQAIIDAMDASRVDAVLFPTVLTSAPLRSDIERGDIESATLPTNTLIAARTGLPAISVPAGFTMSGLPLGMELLGRPGAEAELLRLAHTHEQATHQRREPGVNWPSSPAVPVVGSSVPTIRRNPP